MQATTHTTQIAVLSGKDVRSFMARLIKIGATVQINRPNHKSVTDSEGTRLFSALKYSSGWDCRVNECVVPDLKNILSK